MMVSVIVPTCNRPKKLAHCLRSILSNPFTDFEIIVVDQSNGKEAKKIVNLFAKGKVRYFKLNTRGLSRSLNFALKKARGKVVAFTHDDTIVKDDWLEKINESLQPDEISGVFGRVLPFKKRKSGLSSLFCPCTLQKKEKKVIRHFCRHWEELGFGNNMAFKMAVLKKMGSFKLWLGPGSIGEAGEDGEFTNRVLLKGYTLLYNPEVVVYHNKWLNPKELKVQYRSYSCGGIALYGFYAFQGIKEARGIMIEHLSWSYFRIGQNLKSLLKDFDIKGAICTIKDGLLEVFFCLKGLAIAFWFSKREPIDSVAVYRP